MHKTLFACLAAAVITLTGCSTTSEAPSGQPTASVQGAETKPGPNTDKAPSVLFAECMEENGAQYPKAGETPSAAQSASIEAALKICQPAMDQALEEDKKNASAAPSTTPAP